MAAKLHRKLVKPETAQPYLVLKDNSLPNLQLANQAVDVSPFLQALHVIELRRELLEASM